VNVSEQRIDDVGHSVVVGDSITFGTSAGTDYATFAEVSFVENVGNPVGGTTTYQSEMTGERVFYVVETDTNWFKVATEPGGSAITLRSSGTSVEYVREPRGSGSFAEFNFVQNGNVIYVTHEDGDDFTISVSDGAGNSLVSVYKETSPTFAELPETCPHGFTVKIDGSESNSFDDFYVRFVADSGEGAFGKGIWTEYVAEEIEHRFLNGRMPVIAIRQSDGTFLFKEANGQLGGFCGFSSGSDQVAINHGGAGKLFSTDDEVYFTDLTGALGGSTFFTEGTIYYVIEVSNGTSTQTIQLAATAGGPAINFDAQWTSGNLWKSSYPAFAWGKREVGDTLTNPDPSFVGKTLNSMVYFKNRLGILAGSSLVLSEAGEPFNFFRVTVQDVLPSAPVDVDTTHQEVSELRTAEALNDNLMVMSDRTVYALPSVNGGVTPETASLNVVGSFKLTPEKPVSLGATLFFPYPNGSYSGMYEFFYAPDSDRRFINFDVSEQCKRYIVGTPTLMSGLPNEGMLAVQTDNSDSEFYIYTSVTRGNEKVQSAWQKWSLATGDVMYFKFVDTALYMVVRRQGGGGPLDRDWTVEVIYLDEERTDGTLDYQVKLDRRATVTPSGAYVPNDDQTVVTLPYNIEEQGSLMVVTEDGFVPTIDSVDTAANTVTLSGDYDEVLLYVGESYDSTVTLSQQIANDRDGVPISWPYRMRRGAIYYERSGYLRVEVSPEDTTRVYKYPLEGGEALDYEAPLDDPPALSSGEHRFPVMCRSDRVTISIHNDTHVPMRVISAYFDGEIRNVRGLRL